jgi:hypothetical protein
MFRRTFVGVVLLSGVVTGWTTAAPQEGPEPGKPPGPSRDASPPAASTPSSAGPRRDEPRAAAARNPRVLFVTKKGCERCARELARLRRPGGDFAGLQAAGWKIGDGPENHLQLIDREALPDFLADFEFKEYPVVLCISDGEIVRSFKDGCTTPLDAWTFGFLLKGKNERPPGSIPEAARVETTGSYRLRGNHWSVDGDWNPTRATVLGHLRGPNHGSQIQANWAIESWSYEELRSLHDDLHEREMADAPAGGYPGSDPRPVSSSSSGFGAARKFNGGR